MTLLAWLDAPPSPTPGELTLVDGTLRWSADTIVLERANGARILVASSLQPGSLQLSRWSSTVEVPAASFWRRLVGGTDEIERHELVAELRASTQRLRLRATVDDADWLEGLVRMDAHTEDLVDLDALHHLLAASLALGSRLVRADIGRQGASSSWIEDTGRDPDSTPPTARHAEKAPAPAPSPVPPPSPAPPPDAFDDDDMSTLLEDLADEADDEEVTPIEPLEPVEEPQVEDTPLETVDKVAPVEPPRLERVRVGFGADADTNDLREALDRVLPGGRVELGPGRYAVDATLEVDRPVTLVGAGAKRTTLFGATVPVLRVAAPHDGHVELGALTVTARSGGVGPLLDLCGGRARLTTCTIGPGGGNAGVLARQELTELRAVDCVVTGHGGDGIRIAGQTSFLVQSGVAERNQGDGVSVGEAASGRIERLRVRQNGGAGVRLGDTSRVEVEACSATHNAIGIEAEHGASVTIEGCECMRNEVGIALGPHVSGRVTGNRCVDNATAIRRAAGGQGAVALRDNVTPGA